jgi:hypothetical protein
VRTSMQWNSLRRTVLAVSSRMRFPAAGIRLHDGSSGSPSDFYLSETIASRRRGHVYDLLFGSVVGSAGCSSNIYIFYRWKVSFWVFVSKIRNGIHS